MPLIDMTSDLTSLRFGKDRRGYGDSGQPFFTKDIPERLQSINFATSFLGNDFLVRGGVRSVSAVLEDEIRLGKFLTSFRSPNGLLFIAKQEALARQNPKSPASPDRIYNPFNTIAQAGVSPLGLHFAKDGKVLNIDDNDKYEKKIGTTLNTSTLGKDNKNKLLLLYEANILSSNSTAPSNTPNSLAALLASQEAASVNSQAFRANLGLYGLSEDPELLFQYQGGPNAPLGQKSTIRRFFNTNKGIEENKSNPQTIVYTQDLLQAREKTTTTGFSSDGISNFESVLAKATGNTGVSDEKRKQLIGEPTDYTQFNRAKTYGESDPGATKRDRSVYYTTNVSSLAKNDPNVFSPDAINAQPLYSSTDESARKGPGYDDAIKFNIGVLDLNSTGADRSTTWIHFKAQLENFGDNHQADWQGFKYMGRGNEFYKYGGYRRTISMGFKIAVHSKYEQAMIYSKLNYLASTLAPNYSSGGFMRGNIIKLTVGDYLNNQYGILNGLNFDLDNEAPWDIARQLDGSEDDNSLQLPQIINISSFEFTPIHNFVERTVGRDYVTGETGIPSQQFISLGPGGRGYQFSQNARTTSNGTAIETQS